MFDMRRREFVALLGGAAAAWPVAADAQQSAMPVIGYLYEGSPEPTAQLLAAFRKGLSESGYVEERSVTIEFRWAQGQYDRLPELAAELVRRRVAVIVHRAGCQRQSRPKPPRRQFRSSSVPAATRYSTAVASRPGGNVTGVSAMNVELTAKRLGLLHDLLPGAARFAVLVNPNSPFTESAITDLRKAASSIGRQLEVLTASTNHDINAAFATLVQKRADALFINGDAFFTSRVVQLATLAVHHRVPAIYSVREFVAVGGLISYGASFADMFRQVGIYTGRILRGEKPADLPVLQATKFELVINAQTARMLGLTVPEKLLVAADEVIE